MKRIKSELKINNVILRNWNTDKIKLKRRYDSKTKNLTIDANFITESRCSKNKKVTKELNKFIKRNQKNKLNETEGK